MKIPLYQAIARALEWRTRNPQAADELFGELNTYLPHGSGVDAGGDVNVDDSKPNRVVINLSYHHMNDGGYYDCWTDHCVIIKPDLQWDFVLRIMGRDHNEIKDYLHEMYDAALRELVEEYGKKEKEEQHETV